MMPRHNESLSHMFFVYDIAEFLQKKEIETKLYTTRMPDIVFEINGKKYAIEVETGSVARSLTRIKEKIDILNKVSDEWYFLVTNKRIVQKYRKF